MFTVYWDYETQSIREPDNIEQIEIRAKAKKKDRNMVFHPGPIKQTTRSKLRTPAGISLPLVFNTRKLYNHTTTGRCSTVTSHWQAQGEMTLKFLPALRASVGALGRRFKNASLKRKTLEARKDWEKAPPQRLHILKDINFSAFCIILW